MDVGIRGYSYGNAALQRRYSRSAGGAASDGFLGEMLKTRASEGELDGVYDNLSPASQKTLESLKAGRSDMTTAQWNGLCRELKDMGVITQAEFDYTRGDFHLAPVVSDGRGGVTCPTVVKDFLEGGSRSRWQGDPLAYLDEWVQALKEGRSMADREFWEDGEKKYKDLSPFDRQINACEKVMDVIRSLL